MKQIAFRFDCDCCGIVFFRREQEANCPECEVFMFGVDCNLSDPTLRLTVICPCCDELINITEDVRKEFANAS